MPDLESSTDRAAMAFATPGGIAGEDAHATEGLKSSRNSPNLSHPIALDRLAPRLQLSVKSSIIRAIV
jgi:hypothetical protein